MQNFVAIDFETANFQPSSVCSVGICIVKDGEIVDNYYSLIRPVPNYYCQRCQDVHGLGPSDTNDAPEFPEVWAEAIDRVKQYFPFIEDGEVPFVAHNKAFDENCLKAVFAAYDTKYPDYEFDCTLLKSRKVWPEGHHNLDIIAGYCGYDLKNHHLVVTNCAKWPRRSESRRSVCSSSPHKVNFAGTPKEADAEACAVIGIQIL